MSEYRISENIIIDDEQKAFGILTQRSQIPFKTLDVIYRFIQSEKNTRFYSDERFTCKLEPDDTARVLWLDTGLTDERGLPLFISLVRSGNVFNGHIVGNYNDLHRSHQEYFFKYRRDISNNFSKFISKYKTKSEARANPHIKNADTYILADVNENESFTESFGSCIEKMLSSLGIVLEGDVQEIAEEAPAVPVPEEEDFTEEEEAITISLLYDKLEAVQAYVAELEAMIRKYEKEQIPELEKKNKEYLDALNAVRAFADREKEHHHTEEEVKTDGHSLLQKIGKKILVIGSTEIGVSNMRGIAKSYFGFTNADFEFVDDYEKVKSESKRIIDSKRYYAVITGCMPHKVVGLGDWSNLIEKFRNDGSQMYFADARNAAGGLRVTKSSYKKALKEIFDRLL